MCACHYVRMALTRRTQVLLDDRRDQLLRRRAAATGRSVGSLIREAIDLNSLYERDL